MRQRLTRSHAQEGQQPLDVDRCKVRRHAVAQTLLLVQQLKTPEPSWLQHNRVQPPNHTSK